MKKKLRKIRVDKGISQKEMATIFPMDVSNYNRKELGEVKINKTEWSKIAKFLNVPLEEIYEEDLEKNPKINLKDLVFNVSSLNVQYLELMPSIIENLQSLIFLLKSENEKLKNENEALKQEIYLIKAEKC